MVAPLGPVGIKVDCFVMMAHTFTSCPFLILYLCVSVGVDTSNISAHQSLSKVVTVTIEYDSQEGYYKRTNMTYRNLGLD